MIDKRLMNIVSESKKYIMANVAFQWGSLAANIVMMWFLTQLLAGVYAQTLTQGQIFLTILFAVAAVVVRFFCAEASTRMSFLSSKAVKLRVREMIYEKLLRLGTSYMEQVQTSEVVQLSVEGADQLETYFGAYLPQFFYAMLAPLTLFVVMCFVNVPAAIVLLVCVPLIPMTIVVIQKWAKKMLAKYWNQYTALGDTFLENLQGLTTLKIYQADEYKNHQMNEEAEKFRSITMKVLTMQMNSITIMDLIAYGGAALGAIMAVTQFRAGHTDLAGALFIIVLAADFFIPMRQLGSYFHVAMNGMAAGDKIFRLLDLPEERQGITAGESGVQEDKREISASDDQLQNEEALPSGDQPQKEEASANGNQRKKASQTGARLAEDKAKMKMSAGNGDIVFRSLRFSYTEDREVLHEMDLQIKKGSFTAIVGESGCGKSTIAAILMGRNKGYQGSVKIGGIELRDISEESLMRNLAYVSHQSYLFKGTVRENLLMAKPNAKDAELWRVLERVKLADFLRGEARTQGLENDGQPGSGKENRGGSGLDLMLAEQGSNLSGGQRQRLALARALLYDANVYIFDEATSNIDVESETDIMEQIYRLARHKTVILISHRLANVVPADRIYVLENGNLAEAGTHKELLKNQGVYAKLWNTQAELEKFGSADAGDDSDGEADENADESDTTLATAPRSAKARVDRSDSRKTNPAFNKEETQQKEAAGKDGDRS
ncbi:MAG: ABC transporter ATP-binding protein/permease [Lachnospiraceae bacterium]|nr:ABC transporter ATP-binding protein/permease [Lachnospiraceae bacterium]